MTKARDLSEFNALNAQKATWDKRAKVIHDLFPSLNNDTWRRALADHDTFGRVVRDILKVDVGSETRRPGPRPAPDEQASKERLRQYLGEDYCLDPFPEAFRALVAWSGKIVPGGYSHRGLAAKTGLGRNHIRYLLNGEVRPDAYVMEQVAKAFRKQPSYFLEYREMAIMAALLAKFDAVPEATVSLYRKMMKQESSG